jgi:hypothetical protein
MIITYSTCILYIKNNINSWNDSNRYFRGTEKSNAEKKQHINHHFDDGFGTYYGCLGEILVSDYLNCKIIDDYEYDLVHLNYKFDVKTLICNTTPKQNYECQVAKYYQQDCDGYIFTRILKDSTLGWIVGWIFKKDFLDKAKIVGKDQVREDKTNHVYNGDFDIVLISELNEISALRL